MCRHKYSALPVVAALVTLFVYVSAAAQAPPVPVSTRWDFALEVPNWPSLEDLDPVAGGTFDATGFGLGGSWHWTVKRHKASDLMLGLDGWIAMTDSNIEGVYEDVSARHAYLGMSGKWMLGASRSFSLDAGAGYHEIDIVQLDSSSFGYLEHESWSSSEAGAFVGATWDIAAAKPGKQDGLFIGMRVHFVDFGHVSDRGSLWYSPMLGPDAGDLEGPLYMLRIGYSARR